jgi:hypothetical protein
MARPETSLLERAFQAAIRTATQAAGAQLKDAADARVSLLALELAHGLKGRLTDDEQERRRSLREDLEYAERLADAHEEVARRLAAAFRPEAKRQSGPQTAVAFATRVEDDNAQPEVKGGEPHGIRTTTPARS